MDDTRSKEIRLWLKPAEKKEIDDAAAGEGLNTAAFVRMAALRLARGQVT